MTQVPTLGSVVIPAHNEAAVIGRCLDALFEGMSSGDLEVVVACNGCTDDTATIARNAGHPVQVLEIATPSKPAALRAAERAAGAFPRIYLDADIELTGASARTLLDRLGPGGVLAGRPAIHYQTDRSSLLVRSYYRARARIPEVMGNLWGAGVYGLSEAARSRFGDFPDVVAEDLYVDQRFRTDEIEITGGEPVTVRVPRTMGALFRILRRTYRGKGENRGGSELSTTKILKQTSTRTVFHQVIASSRAGPAEAADALVYVGLTLIGRVLAMIAKDTGWERDNSSRQD